MKRTPVKRGKGFRCSPAQREKAADNACIVCGQWGCDPAHLIPRSLAPDPEGDPLRVVPLCRRDHEAYDLGAVDLSPFLEPRYRDEAAEAVRQVGLWRAVERITNQRWTEDAA
jgi:hypothetical protein